MAYKKVEVDRRKTSTKMGRPKKEFNVKLFENLCHIQCTHAEIAACMDLDVDTVQRHVQSHYQKSFTEVYKEKTDKGRMSLRRIQLKLAEKNAAMAIWLGKQYLGQRDHEKEALESQQRQHFYMLARQLNMLTPQFDNKNVVIETRSDDTLSDDLSQKSAVAQTVEIERD